MASPFPARAHATVLHLDLDAFFAAVEQRDKPSLRGKPVIVGGVGGRGVVSTASYEARRFGVRSAMPSSEARRRCPHAAFLSGRFGAYRQASRVVMALLQELSPLVEQLSIDEAFVDLAAPGAAGVGLDSDALRELGERVRADVVERTGGLTASVGLGSSKFMAKLASEMAKPDGLLLIEPGTEVETISPLPVRAIPGVGPVTAEKLNRLGVETIADVQRWDAAELTREVGQVHGAALRRLACGEDPRPVDDSRETKSISVEHTFETDVRSRDELHPILARDAATVAGRVTAERVFARTVSIKVRLGDFTTMTRSRTLPGATDDPATVAAIARELLDGVDITEGVRLLGVGAANFTDSAQEMLFGAEDGEPGAVVEESASAPATAGARGETGTRWRPGQDVSHTEWGDGWVWGSGMGRVTVRFETSATPAGPVRTLADDDPDLTAREYPEAGENG